MEVTPQVIEILLHFHSSPMPHQRHGSPSVESDIARLINEGMLRRRPGHHDDTRFETTERGKVWVAMLCSTPFPERVWRNPVNGMVLGG